MTLIEWKEKVNNCDNKEELKLLMKEKPNKDDTVVNNMVDVFPGNSNGLPLLERLRKGK